MRMFIYSSRSTDSPYLCQSNKVQPLKYTQSIKTKNIPLKDISVFCAMLTEDEPLSLVLPRLPCVISTDRPCDVGKGSVQ